MLTIKVKKVHKDAQLPKRAHSTDTGADLHSVEDVIILPWQRVVISTGLHMWPTQQWVDLQVRSRSGLAAKNGICVLNAPATIDASYTGLWKIILMNNSDEPFEVRVGDRIAQMVVCPHQPIEFVEVEELDQTDRNEAGFGSSGVR